MDGRLTNRVPGFEMVKYLIRICIFIDFNKLMIDA